MVEVNEENPAHRYIVGKGILEAFQVFKLWFRCGLVKVTPFGGKELIKACQTMVDVLFLILHQNSLVFFS